MCNFFLQIISKKKGFCKKSENPLLPYAEDCNLCKYSLFGGRIDFCNLKVSKLSRQRYIGPSFGMQQCRENSRLPHKAHFSWQSIYYFFGAFEVMASHSAIHETCVLFPRKNVVSPFCRFGECVSFYKQPNQGEEQSWVSI